jgi:hypothetical protein
MPRLPSIVLLSTLLSCTALGAGLDPVRIGRYSAIVAGPASEQADPFALPGRRGVPRSGANGRSRDRAGPGTERLPACVQSTGSVLAKAI